MIDELKEEEIVNKVGGRFKLSTLIQKRMIALNQGARPLVDMRGADKMSIVIQEIMQDKIFLDVSGKLQTVEPTEDLEMGGETIDLTGGSSPAIHPDDLLDRTPTVPQGPVFGSRAPAKIEVAHVPDDVSSHPAEEASLSLDAVPGNPPYPLRRTMELRVVDTPARVTVRPLDSALDERLAGCGSNLDAALD